MLAPLRTTVVDELDYLERLVPAWHRLLAAAPGSHVFQSPEWVLTWLRHFQGCDRLHVVVVSRGEELVGLAPYVRMRVGARPLHVDVLIPAGAEQGEYGSPLVGPEPPAVADAIVDHLRDLVATTATIVDLVRLEDDSLFSQAVDARHCERERVVELVRVRVPIVRFDKFDDPAAELARLARAHRLPRRRRRLEEGWRIEHTPSDCSPEAIDALFNLHELRWAKKDGRMQGLFSTERHRSFVHEVVPALDRRGMVRLRFLTADSRRFSGSLTMRLGGSYLYLKSGFDPAMAKFAPGQLELHATLSAALEEGMTVVDLGRGDEEYKAGWANDERHTRNLALVRRGFGEARLAMLRGALSLRARRARRPIADARG